MFDSKQFIGIVVHASDGERVFWATSIKEYHALGCIKGKPETGTVTTLDREGHYQQYSITEWEDKLQEEAEWIGEVNACYPEEASEHDWDQLDHDEALAAYEKQRQETLAKLQAQAEKIPF